MTCRKAREFLLQQGVQFRERDLAREPLTEAEIRSILAGRSPSEIFSWKSVRARQEGIEPGTRADEELIQLMATDSNLIRRPLLAVDGKIAPGFNQPAWEELLRR